jgi:hypothetical protein
MILPLPVGDLKQYVYMARFFEAAPASQILSAKGLEAVWIDSQNTIHSIAEVAQS